MLQTVVESFLAVSPMHLSRSDHEHTSLGLFGLLPSHTLFGDIQKERGATRRKGTPSHWKPSFQRTRSLSVA